LAKGGADFRGFDHGAKWPYRNLETSASPKAQATLERRFHRGQAIAAAPSSKAPRPSAPKRLVEAPGPVVARTPPVLRLNCLAWLKLPGPVNVTS